MSLIIQNAKIVDTQKISQKTHDILLERGLIVKIAPSLKTEGHKVIDAKGRLAMPGLIDLHTHLRQPGQEHKETIETGSKAAAKGGFTTILCMPNTDPVVDSRMIVEGIIKEAKRVGLINVLPIGAITRGQKGQELCDIFELKEAGCVALSDDGRSVQNSQIMRHALEYAAMVGIPIIEHCEDPYTGIENDGVMNEGVVSTVLGLKGLPAMAECIIVARDIELAHYLKIGIHFAHVSLKRSVELIRSAKKQGIKITAEACPHHFTLTHDAVKKFDTNTKVNPPLRSQEDVEAIKEAIKDGTIDCIATDHAPHALEEKELEFDLAPFGIIGLETALGLTIAELVDKRVISLPQAVGKLSAVPAKIIGLQNKGEIKEGKDADIIIVDPDHERVFEKEEIISKSKNSPFIGRKLKGLVLATICGGKIVYQAE